MSAVFAQNVAVNNSTHLRRGVRAGESRSLPLPLRPPLRARRSASRAGLSGECSRDELRECGPECDGVSQVVSRIRIK